MVHILKNRSIYFCSFFEVLLLKHEPCFYEAQCYFSRFLWGTIIFTSLYLIFTKSNNVYSVFVCIHRWVVECVGELEVDVLFCDSVLKVRSASCHGKLKLNAWWHYSIWASEDTVKNLSSLILFEGEILLDLPSSAHIIHVIPSQLYYHFADLRVPSHSPGGHCWISVIGNESESVSCLQWTIWE